MTGLTNLTHKINGERITYECSEWPYDDFQNSVVAVGNNKTLKFRKGGLDIAFVADPSYNIGGLEEDNTLMLRRLLLRQRLRRQRLLRLRLLLSSTVRSMRTSSVLGHSRKTVLRSFTHSTMTTQVFALCLRTMRA